MPWFPDKRRMYLSANEDFNEEVELLAALIAVVCALFVGADFYTTYFK